MRIDLHCHILPGLDDGAVDLGDSLAMAAQAAEDGINVICATPHIRHDHDVVIDELAARVAELNRELIRRSVPVTIAAGGEVSESALGRLERAELEAVALGAAGRWILLEPAPGPLSDSLAEAAESLRKKGFGALIAHPERHPGPDLGERLAALIAGGALVQATADHFVAPETGPAMAALAGRGLIHVLGSDAHSARFGRPVALGAGLSRLRDLDLLAPHMTWIETDAPRAILAGTPVEPPFSPQPPA